jgi:hypothetical protein
VVLPELLQGHASNLLDHSVLVLLHCCSLLDAHGGESVDGHDCFLHHDVVVDSAVAKLQASADKYFQQ